MENLLKRGTEWLGLERTRSMSDPVSYTHGVQSVTIPATVGKTEFPVQVEPGVVREWQGRDYLVLASDLATVLVDSGGEPQPGDTITDPVSGQIFLVSAPSGADVWAWSGVPGVTMRIHTKRVS